MGAIKAHVTIVAVRMLDPVSLYYYSSLYFPYVFWTFHSFRILQANSAIYVSNFQLVLEIYAGTFGIFNFYTKIFNFYSNFPVIKMNVKSFKFFKNFLVFET